MFGHVTKLGIASMVVGGVALQTDIVREPAEAVVARVQSVIVQAEMDSIEGVIVMEHTAGGDVPTQSELSGFLRQNMNTAPGVARDVAADHWGNRYQIEDYGYGFRLISAGPDGLYDNDDDLVIVHDWA
jgi:hypothetical protein